MKAFICFVFLITASFSAASQGCDCPGINTCGACSAGLTELTLQFNGSNASVILVTDQLGTVFSQTVDPGEKFTFTGSQVNEKFVGPSIEIFINNISNTTISTGCSGFAIGKVVGMFTIRAAKSKSGGIVCCPAAIVDKVAPQIQGCPTNKNVTLPLDKCVVSVPWTAPTATDNCTLDGMTKTHEPGAEFGVGITTVKYIAKDIYGNGQNCTFTVTVSDVTAPKITGCPSDIRAAVTGSCNAVVTWPEPTVSDNCSAILSSSHPRGSTFPVGTTTVTYTAVDPSGNSAETCSFDVIVENTEKPAITGCPRDTTINAGDNGPTIVSWSEPSASVVCGQLAVTKTHSPGTSFAIGNTEVQYTFTDDFGKISTCSFTVKVLESNVPFLISQIVTPDGDGVNDRWELTNIEKYADNTVVILDRWGGKIFEKSSYDNVNIFWDGTNTSGAIVPTGTYFYSIEIRTQDTVIKKTGFLELIK